MTSSNLERRLSALETQMQEMRDLLQQTIQVQNQTAANLDRLEQVQARTQQQLNQTQDIANSNARSIQAWENLINQNQDEAEEERSVLRVNINNLSAGMTQFQIGMDELRQASRENIAQHFEFRERFDRVMSELQEIKRGRTGAG